MLHPLRIFAEIFSMWTDPLITKPSTKRTIVSTIKSNKKPQHTRFKQTHKSVQSQEWNKTAKNLKSTIVIEGLRHGYSWKFPRRLNLNCITTEVGIKDDPNKTKEILIKNQKRESRYSLLSTLFGTLGQKTICHLQCTRSCLVREENEEGSSSTGLSKLGGPWPSSPI